MFRNYLENTTRHFAICGILDNFKIHIITKYHYKSYHSVLYYQYKHDK